MKAPSRKNVFQMFNHISKTYDKTNRFISLGLDQTWRKKLLKALPDQRQIHLLDLATGTADQLICLLEHQENIVKAVGVDLAEEMLKIGKKKIEDKPYRHKVSFVKADAQELPFEDNSYECITMSFGIRNVESPQKCLKEMYRLLTKGGRALILETSIPKNELLKKLHSFHLKKVLPLIGGLLAKNRKAYQYLNKTTETFSHGKSFVNLLKEAGFTNVSAETILFGAITLYSGDKNG
jgi:demethylmenaquinone methyltransferase/2-methoxy-6-polyprenyl-1,4-benzoquinol methylase